MFIFAVLKLKICNLYFFVLGLKPQRFGVINYPTGKDIIKNPTGIYIIKTPTGVVPSV